MLPLVAALAFASFIIGWVCGRFATLLEVDARVVRIERELPLIDDLKVLEAERRRVAARLAGRKVS